LYTVSGAIGISGRSASNVTKLVFRIGLTYLLKLGGGGGMVAAAGSARRLAVLIHTASRSMTWSISSTLSVYASLFAGIFTAFVSWFCSMPRGPARASS
jgi:hypothetical protein